MGAIATIVALLALPATASAAGFMHHPFRHGGGRPTPGAAIVSLESGPYGPVLVVGGAGAGYMPATSTTAAGYLFPAGTSLYEPTIDPPDLRVILLPRVPGGVHHDRRRQRGGRARCRARAPRRTPRRTGPPSPRMRHRSPARV